MGLSVSVLTSSNANDVLKSADVMIVLISPELLHFKQVVQSLLSVRTSVVIKCIDEAHLFKAWGIDKNKGKNFRPAMQLATGELSTLG